MKSALRDIARAFLPVNPFAGKLRALLSGLVVFILWTVNAQNRSLPADGLIQFQPESGFIADVLLDLAGRYIHPGTLLLTFIPVALFKLALAQAAGLLRQASGESTASAAAYLKRCAFASSRISTEATALAQTDALQTLGGPAEIRLAPDVWLLIRSTDHYFLVRGRDGQVRGKYALPHREQIAGVMHADNLILPVDFSHQEKAYRVYLHTQLAPGDNDEPSGSPALSKHDADYLLALNAPEALLLPLLGHAIQRYLRSLDSEVAPLTAENSPRAAEADERQREEHDNYAHTIAPVLPQRKGFARPRRHSLYHAHASSENDESMAAPADDMFLSGLEGHIRQEMVSFFGLENIHITLTNRGNA